MQSREKLLDLPGCAVVLVGPYWAWRCFGQPLGASIMPSPNSHAANDASHGQGRLEGRLQPAVQTVFARVVAPHDDRQALPWIGTALLQGEIIHRALLSVARHREAMDSPVLTGKSLQGDLLPLHQRLHIFCLSLAGDGKIDFVLMWGPQGLDYVARHAALHLGVFRNAAGCGELSLEVLDVGNVRDLIGCPKAQASGLAAFVRPSRIWYSRTPFVALHRLEGEKSDVAAQIQHELAVRSLPPAIAVEVLEGAAERVFGFSDYCCSPPDPQLAPPWAKPWAVRLEFEQPVSGPIALGYGMLVGLGLFEGE